MRVSELGICAAPLAFVQFASGLQMTLSQCCLFSVIMYYEVVIAVVVVFFRGGGGSWTPFLYLLAIWRLCRELGQISCPPKQPINFTRPDT